MYKIELDGVEYQFCPDGCGELHPINNFDGCPYESDEYKNRTFYKKPIRWISKHCHPSKITKEQFIKEIANALEPWSKNMDNMAKNDKFKYLIEDKYMEEWIEQFLSWFEVEQEE